MGETISLTAPVDVTGGSAQDVNWSRSDDADATVSDTVAVALTAMPATRVSNLAVSIVLGCQVDLTWAAVNVDSFDVVCDDGAGDDTEVVEAE